MRIIVNDQPMDIPDGTTLQDLIRHLRLEGQRFAVAVNGTVVPRDHLDGYRLQEGDQVEIVYAVGGG